MNGSLHGWPPEEGKAKYYAEMTARNPARRIAAHGYAPTTTYDLVWEKRTYPPKAILGTAYEFAVGQRLASGDFEGGKSGAVKVLGALGFDVQPRHPAS
jgi:hypothetical protein